MVSVIEKDLTSRPEQDGRNDFKARAGAESIQMDVKLLTVAQAATMLSLGRSKAYELVMKGDIRSITIGRSRRIPVQALDEFIQERVSDSDPGSFVGR